MQLVSVVGRSSGQRYSGAAAVCLLYRAGPPCIAAVMLRRLLCGEKIHRKLFLNSGGRGETDSEGNKCRVAATMADLS